MDKKIIHLDTVGSTNDYALKLLSEGKTDTFAVIAEHQSNGHGRLGRSFHSPDGVGIYMTLIVENRKIKNLKLLTSLAGLAVAEAIDKLYETDCKIKWPNDIFLCDKKICGILTKLVSDRNTGKITHALVGIGVDVNNERKDFPDELKEIASSILIETGKFKDKKLLEEEIIKRTDELLFSENSESEKLVEKIRKRSYVIGKKVFIKKENKEFFAEDISSDGELIVSDGEKKLHIFSGEAELIDG